MSIRGDALAIGKYGSVMVDNSSTILTGTDISNPVDLTKYIVSATSAKNYINNRKMFYYATGLMDTLPNNESLKSTVLKFTAEYTGQLKFRIVLPNSYGLLTRPLSSLEGFYHKDRAPVGYAIYDAETNKEVQRGDITYQDKTYPLYDTYNIEKGKSYYIVFNSCGTAKTIQFEMFTMKYHNPNTIYKQNTWYTRTMSRYYDSTNAESVRQNCLKVKVTKKSKITVYIKSLATLEEGVSLANSTYLAYSNLNLNKGIKKVLFENNMGKKVEFGNKLGTFTVTVEKGTYYIPLCWSKRGYDVNFKYTVTPVD